MLEEGSLSACPNRRSGGKGEWRILRKLLAFASIPAAYTTYLMRYVRSRRQAIINKDESVCTVRCFATGRRAELR